MNTTHKVFKDYHIFTDMLSFKFASKYGNSILVTLRINFMEQTSGVSLYLRWRKKFFVGRPEPRGKHSNPNGILRSGEKEREESNK